MNDTDFNCDLDITNKFYTRPDSRRFYFPLAVLNCVIDGCLPITSVGGSALLLVAVFKFPQLREAPSNLLLASQAVSDLLVGVLIQPFITARHASFLAGGCLFAGSNFWQGFASYWIHALLYSSCLNICLITVDRYICIAHSLRYQTIVTQERVLRAIGASWVFSLAFASIQAMSFHPYSIITRSTARIFAVNPPALLALVIFVCYFIIAKIARRHKRQIQAQMNASPGPTAQDFRSSKTTLLMVSITLLFCVPVVIVVLVLYASKKFELLEAAMPFVATLACLNPSINPLVYFARSRKIRHYVWKVVKCE